MKSFIIQKNDAGQRLDKFALKAASGLSSSLMYKYIRKKAIKVNGKRCEISYKLCENDLVEMYINDEFFKEKNNSFLKIAYETDLDVLYEDDNLMLINKKAGVLVHEDSKEGRDTLINQVLLYLYKNGIYDPEKEMSFRPSLCNRLDKNTGGIVIVAKNAEAQRALYDIVKLRKVKKLYIALVHGAMPKTIDTLVGYLKKDSDTNTVTIKDKEFEDSKKIITKYTVLQTTNKLSLVEVELVTGRTHQIRAHLAHIGHPVVGDCKYGTSKLNEGLPYKHQALYAYSLEFNVEKDNMFSYLNGRVFNVQNVYFADFLNKTIKIEKY